MTCNHFKVWLWRALKSLEDDGEYRVVRGYNMLNKKEKDNFKIIHCGLIHVPSLVMAIKRLVALKYHSDILQAITAGRLLDEVGLTEKYASKPDQLKAIFKNAIRVVCPLRDVTLWCDPGLADTQWLMTQKDEKEQVNEMDEKMRKKDEKNKKKKKLYRLTTI